MQQNVSTLKVSPPAVQAPQESGWEEGGPAPQLPAARGGGEGAVPSATSGLGSATGPVVGKYSTATHQPRGPRRQTWCGRGAGSRPPACSDARSPPGCRPPGEARGCGPCCRACSTSSPQALSRPGQPGHPPTRGWADKTTSQCQEPVRLVDKSGHCPPLPGLSQAASERCLRNRCSPGRLVSPRDPSPSPGDPHACELSPRQRSDPVGEGC